MMPSLRNIKIAIVGLGYVGLPLAVAFGKSRFAPVIGLDKNPARINSLRGGQDPNKDVMDTDIATAGVEYTLDPTVLSRANFIVVTVSTPINQAKQPDLSPLIAASETIGKYIKLGTVVVYESTVYPGVTEDICVPLIEKYSGLKYGVDFKVGYSPERINPGDREHTLATTVKVVSGMDQKTCDLIAAVYEKVCKGGVHKAPNIKTAEAAKVIENIQRDLNIALINELALIFQRIGIHTRDVIEAAGTKWNFHTYLPGLVGGHCIGVDPYYLTHRAQELGYNPEVILAGRRINDSMSEYVADLTIRGLVEAGKVVQGSRVLIMGLTFKENIRDTRNSKIKDTIKKLQAYGVHVLGHDPNLYKMEVEEFGVEQVADLITMGNVDGIILATPHTQFETMTIQDFLPYYDGGLHGVLVDVKSRYLTQAAQCSGLIYKCL